MSDTIIAQTTSSHSATTRPHNFLNASRRRQIKATLEAAQATGRKAWCAFGSGDPAPEVRAFITRNAEKIGLRLSDVIIAVPPS